MAGGRALALRDTPRMRVKHRHVLNGAAADIEIGDERTGEQVGDLHRPVGLHVAPGVAGPLPVEGRSVGEPRPPGQSLGAE